MPTKTNPPIVDLGNYPVIFASAVGRIDRIGHGMASIAMVEERRNDQGQMEWIIVCRLIRPAASVVRTAIEVARQLGEAGMEDVIFAAADSPAGMQ
jgi:hypothetical protein